MGKHYSTPKGKPDKQRNPGRCYWQNNGSTKLHRTRQSALMARPKGIGRTRMSKVRVRRVYR